MGSFERTPEYRQSLRMRPACNRVLCESFGVSEDAIKRFGPDDAFILDQEFAIDLRVTLPNGTTITGQEKALSHRYYGFKTFTMEFYQNMRTMEKGEFFKIASQFYLSGYSDESGIDFIEWKIIDVIALQLWMRKWSEHELSARCIGSGGSRACFLPIKYSDIPADCILFSGKKHPVQSGNLELPF